MTHLRGTAIIGIAGDYWQRNRENKLQNGEHQQYARDALEKCLNKEDPKQKQPN